MWQWAQGIVPSQERRIPSSGSDDIVEDLLHISIILWSSLDSREAVPISLNDRKPWSTSWYVISALMRQLIIPNIAFYRTSTSMMPIKYPFPFVRKTTVYPVPSIVRVSYLKAVYTRSTISYQWILYYSWYRIASIGQPWSCSTCIRKVLPKLCQQRPQTSHSITPPWGIESMTGSGSIPTGIFSTGRGTWLYSATRSVVILV